MTRLRLMERVASGLPSGRDYVVTLAPGTVTLRPKRSRDPEAAVSVTWDWIYQHAMMTRHGMARPARRRR